MQKTLPVLVAAALAAVIAWPKGMPELPTTRLDDEELVELISEGEEVTLDAHLVKGKWTLVEFGAKW